MLLRKTKVIKSIDCNCDYSEPGIDGILGGENIEGKNVKSTVKHKNP